MRLVYIYIKYGKSFAIYLLKYTAITAYRGLWQQKQMDKCLRSTYSYVLYIILEHIPLSSLPLKNGLAKIENVGVFLLINLAKTLLSLV